MDKTKNIKSIKQVTIKRKIITFVIFFLFLNVWTFSQSQGLINMPNVADYVENIYVDGTDFTGITNLLISGFNGVFYIINFIIGIILNIIFILVLTLVFDYVYFKSFCLEKEKFISSIKKIIWVMSIANILIGTLLNLNTNVNILILSIVCIYLPLPILVQVLFFNKFKKTYQTIFNTKSESSFI